MRSQPLLLALASIAFLGSTASAQKVAGTWAITYDADIRRDGEDVTVNSRRTTRLVLEQRGDSVFGTFGDDAMPEPPRKVSGTFDGKTLKLTTGTTRRTVRINGQATEMDTRTDIMGAVHATGMRGVMLLQVGDRPAPPRKWEAVPGRP